MRVLFDNGTPRGVAAALAGHVVEEARSRGWDTLRTGELLDAAEAAGFDVFVTTERNIRHQQILTDRKIAIVVLGKGRWRLIKLRLQEIAAVIAAATPGSFAEVEIPSIETCRSRCFSESSGGVCSWPVSLLRSSPGTNALLLNSTSCSRPAGFKWATVWPKCD